MLCNIPNFHTSNCKSQSVRRLTSNQYIRRWNFTVFFRCKFSCLNIIFGLFRFSNFFRRTFPFCSEFGASFCIFFVFKAFFLFFQFFSIFFYFFHFFHFIYFMNFFSHFYFLSTFQKFQLKIRIENCLCTSHLTKMLCVILNTKQAVRNRVKSLVWNQLSFSFSSPLKTKRNQFYPLKTNTDN